MCNILNNIIYMDPFTTLMVMTSALTFNWVLNISLIIVNKKI